MANILTKARPTDGDGSLELGAVHADLLQAPAERALYDAVQQAQADIASHSEQLDYTPILQRLAQLEQPLAQFFADVMVNVEDESLRHNRLALLKQVRDLFLQVADISQLQS